MKAVSYILLKAKRWWIHAWYKVLLPSACPQRVLDPFLTPPRQCLAWAPSAWRTPRCRPGPSSRGPRSRAPPARWPLACSCSYIATGSCSLTLTSFHIYNGYTSPPTLPASFYRPAPTSPPGPFTPISFLLPACSPPGSGWTWTVSDWRARDARMGQSLYLTRTRGWVGSFLLIATCFK